MKTGKEKAVKSFLSVTWSTPGEKPQEGLPSARAAKAVGATIVIASACLRFHVYHHDNWGDERFSWRLVRLSGMGDGGEISTPVDEFASMREAVRKAKKLAASSSR